MIKTCIKQLISTSFFTLKSSVFFSYLQCGTNGYYQLRMLFREHVIVNNEQVNTSKWTRTNLFWNILLTSTKYLENIIWHMGQNIWWCRGTFCHMFMDEWYLWMKMLTTNENGRTFSWMLATNCFFAKNQTKEWKNIILVCFEKFSTWNVEVILQVIFYISLIWSILSSATSKPYKMLD